MAAHKSRLRSRPVLAWTTALTAACLFSTAQIDTVRAQGKGDPEAKTSEPSVATNTAGWTVNCASGKDGLNCQVLYTLALKETKQRLLSIVVRMAPQAQTPTMLFQLPLGILIPAGTTLQIDKRSPQAVPLQSCDPNGCYASLPLADADLAALQKGQMLRVTFQNLQKQAINIDVPLTGFSAAYAKIK